MKRAIAYLTANPARFFLVAAIFWIIIMGILNAKEGIQWDDILVEANGMVFDLLVFGVLLSVYESLRQKRDKIERLKEEIDDYRHWDEKEATFRIIGAVKRLNKLGISEINLAGCFLRKVRCFEINLSKATLENANLSKAILVFSNLSRANLSKANLSGAALMICDLSNANLSNANLSGAKLKISNYFKKNQNGMLILEEFTFSGANLTGVNLLNAEVDKNWFEKLVENNVEGCYEIIDKYYIDDGGIIKKRSNQ